MKTRYPFMTLLVGLTLSAILCGLALGSSVPVTRARGPAQSPDAVAVPWATKGNKLGGGDYLGSKNNQPLVFKTNKVERMRLDTAGNVGIGTNAPSRTLDVNGVVGVFDGNTHNYYGGIATELGAQLIDFGINEDNVNRFGGNYTSADQGGLVRVDTRAGANLFQFLARAAGSTSAVAEVMGITSSGKVGIGSTTPSRTLDVNGVIGVFDSNNRARFGGVATEAVSKLIDFGMNEDYQNRFGGNYVSADQGGLVRVDTRAGQNLFQFLARPASAVTGVVEVMSITSSGNLHVIGTIKVGTLAAATVTNVCINGSVLSSCSSSKRYKENIAGLDLGLDAIKQLRPVTFDWKDRKEHDLGLIAEDVNQVSPLLTTRNADGQIEGVKYDQMSAVLINGMQEQQQQIEALKQQNQSLQARLTALEQAQGQTHAEPAPIPTEVWLTGAVVLLGILVWQRTRAGTQNGAKGA